MNFKALITTLVLGSSSMASADSLTFSGSVSLSVGGSASTRPAARPLPSRAHYVGDSCDAHAHTGYTPAPRYPAVPTRPVVYTPPAPIWDARNYTITNTIVGKEGSAYKGTFGVSKVTSPYHRILQPWFALTEATRIDSGRQYFKLGTDKGLFSALRLEALGNGRSKINQVYVEFLDNVGTKKGQVVKLDTWIGRTNPTITIDLDGGYRAINRVIVYGSTDQGSAYKLSAK